MAATMWMALIPATYRAAGTLDCRGPFRWTGALLLGAVVASSDAAAVFATLRHTRIRHRLARTLEAESGANDPVAIALTAGLIAGIEQRHCRLVPVPNRSHPPRKRTVTDCGLSSEGQRPPTMRSLTRYLLVFLYRSSPW
jgi:hypothetical protein